MAYRSFRQFLDALEQAGELKRVAIPVDTDLLIAEWADREMKSPGGGKALLFEHPIVGWTKIQNFRLQSTRWDRADGWRLHCKSQTSQISHRRFNLSSKRNRQPICVKAGACSNKESICCMRVQNLSAKRRARKSCTSSAMQKPFSLRDLPILKCWPKDGGRFITLPNVHTRDPETGARNIGIYRMQVYDEDTTAMHWQLHKVGARHGKRYYERGERMPVAVTLGGDPVYTFAATAPLPDGLDELFFAGFLRKKSIELVRCKTIDLEVPADVDFVLEGYVQPGEMRP